MEAIASNVERMRGHPHLVGTSYSRQASDRVKAEEVSQAQMLRVLVGAYSQPHDLQQAFSN